MPDNTGLSGLTVNAGTMDPVFDAPGAKGYAVSVADDVTSIVITPTTTDPHAKVTSIPPDTDTNSPGIQVNLPIDRTRVDFTVTAENGVTTRPFFIEVFRDHPPATNARLSGLTLSDVTFAEDFDSRTYAYTTDVASTLTETTVTATPLDPDAEAVIKLNGTVDADGTVNLAAGSNVITVEVTAEDGTTMQTYTVTVTRMVSNSAPTFNSNMATRTLPENSSGGTSVGSAVMATDSDTLTYSLGGTDVDSFNIDSSNGQIKTRNVATYDFESTKKTYDVTVSVHDGKDTTGNTDTTIDDAITVTINLTNVNEAPSVTGTSSKSESENRAVSTPIGNYTAADPDASSTFTWSLEGDDADDFRINPQGELRLRSSPDYESRRTATPTTSTTWQ